jgi:hypothetical protein
MATSIWLSGKGPVEILPVPETIRDSENLKSGKLAGIVIDYALRGRKKRKTVLHVRGAKIC